MMASVLSLLLVLPLAFSSTCPENFGYSQSPNGDCYKVDVFYNIFIPQYESYSFDQAMWYCNMEAGGFLTSIHSKEDNDAVMALSCDQSYRNIGLRCKGKDCAWNDGTPLTYTNFKGKGPKDDDTERCYGFTDSERFKDQWDERGCGPQARVCWICRVKPRTFDCAEGETEYRGGCITVVSTPLDQATAEAACPGGGRLVSIHSDNENEIYKKAALSAGVTGTIYIGGQYSNGHLEWSDRTRKNYDKWANQFPNTLFGTCVQMLLASEFGVQGQWTNIDCTTKQPYMCFRDGSEHDSTMHPKADAKCPPLQYFSGSGKIYSPNYPLSIPGQQSCEYVVVTMEGFRATVQFPSYDCQSGTTLSLMDGLNGNQAFATFTSTPPSPTQSFSATSNVIKLVFSTNGTSSPVGSGWEADFNGI